jgi:hypothetical protein
MKRLLVSIVIATLLTAALLACLNGAPVVRAQGGDTPTFIDVQLVSMSDDCKDYCDPDGCSGSCSFDPYVSGPAGGVSWSGNTGWPHHSPDIRYRTQISSDTAIESISFWLYNDSGDPDAPLRKESGWPPGSWGLPFAWPFGLGCSDLEIAPDRSYVVYSNTCEPITFLQSETETHLDKDVLSDFEYFEFSFDWEIRSVNGQAVDVPTDCVPIEDVTLHGPATATVGTPVWFESELTPVSPTRPVSWTFDVTYGPDGQQVKTVSGRSSGRVQATWYNTGTKTITVTASNCEGYGYATDSTTITLDHKYQWTPPFSVTVPAEPVLDCTHCPAPNWGFWQIGHWIDWLWCNLKCWFEYFLEFLYWLWKMLYATLSSMINAFMEQFWIGVNNLLLMIDYHGERIAVNVEAFFEEIAEFARGLVFEVRDWIAELLTRLADWIEENSDELGDSLQQYINEVRDWLYDGLTEIAEVLDGWGDFGSWMADNTRAFRDWAYEELTDLAQFFQGWNNEIGDFLSNATTEFRDWLYDLLTELVLFWDGWAEFFYTAADRVRRFRDWLYDWMTELGEWINATVTNAGAFVADVVRDYRDWLYDILTWYGNFVYGNITGIGEYLANSVRRLAKLLQILVLTWANVVSALAIFALAILDIIDLVIEKAVDGLGILIYVSGLTGDLVTGLRDAINSSSTADIYQDVPGLYYFWRGMTFFEDTVGSSPLAVLNLVAIGIIGINLSLWTVGQVGDLMEDVARL